MTTHEIRKRLAVEGQKPWTQEDMANQWGIPLATIKNWDARNCMPPYIFNMLDDYIYWREKYRREKEKVHDLIGE